MSNWMVPYERLDDSQKKFVDVYGSSSNSKNVWVVGYAGSGKSLLLVHALKSIKDENERLGRRKKYAVVVFTRALGDLFKTGLSELGITGVPIMTQFELAKRQEHFDYIFCDEIQDLSKETLQLIKSRATTVIAAGDSNQSIYAKDLRTNTPTVRDNEPLTVLNASAAELNIIYRLTQSVIAAVKKLMPHMARNWTAREDLTKVDVQITLRKAVSREKEYDFVYNDARKCVSRGERTAILFPLHEQILAFVNTILQMEGKPYITPSLNSFGRPNYDELNKELERYGVPIMYIGNSYGSLEEAQRRNKVIIMTYSSSKGLDFENVYIPNANRSLYSTHNPVLDKTTFMVAMTRSSHYLTISYTGQPSAYVDTFRDLCHFVDEARKVERSLGESIF